MFKAAADSREGRVVALGQGDDAQDERQEQQEHCHATHKAFLLADGAVDEVGVLLGDVFEFGLCADRKSVV